MSVQTKPFFHKDYKSENSDKFTNMSGVNNEMFILPIRNVTYKIVNYSNCRHRVKTIYQSLTVVKNIYVKNTIIKINCQLL